MKPGQETEGPPVTEGVGADGVTNPGASLRLPSLGWRGEEYYGDVYINQILYYLRKKKPNYKIFILKFHSLLCQRLLRTCFHKLRLNHKELPISADQNQSKTGHSTRLDLI